MLGNGKLEGARIRDKPTAKDGDFWRKGGGGASGRHHFPQKGTKGTPLPLDILLVTAKPKPHNY